MKTWTSNIGLWGTEQQGKQTWIVSADGKPVCMCDESGERSIAKLATLGYTVVPRDGQTAESLLATGYLDA